jgi:asparagine synthase (glutamine-hydrolysing)
VTPPVFLAILNPQHTEASAAWTALLAERTDLAAIIDTGGLAIFAGPGTAWVPVGTRGALIGDLREAGSATKVERLAAAPAETLGRRLVNDFWGDYVAIADQADASGAASIFAARAPSGGLHAFRARRDALVFLSSHIELLHALGLAPAVIDEDFLAHHLAFSHLHTGATGIAGVDEILPGENAIETGHGSMPQTLWSPWSFASPDRRIDDFGQAAQHVREAVLLAVAALVEPDTRVALELSGGLDSSIVAAALAAKERAALGINLVTPGGEGDERLYARAVSEQTGIALVEEPIDGEIDLTRVEPRVEARPGMLAMLRLADESFARVGSEEGVTAFVNGTGGDCVFCSLGTSAPAADRLRAHGFGAGFVRTIHDVARVHHSHIWAVARLALRRWRRARPSPIWPRNRVFLNEARLPPEPAFHPWLDEPPGTLGGSRAHVHAILASYSHLDGYGRQAIAPSLFPLLSQPVVEACLAVPSWLWVAHGRDRAVARAAFRADLPRIVAERRTKGGMDAFCARTVELNRERLRPFLLDGLVADAGLLDRAAVESYLARPFANRDQLFYHLLPIIDTELWVRALVAGGR